MSIAELILSDPKLTGDEAAKFIGLESAQTLAVWRCTGRYALPYIKCGRSIRYRLSDLQKFLTDNTHVGAVTPEVADVAR